MDRLPEVRRAIYAAIVRSGRAPGAADLAPALGMDADAVGDAYRALADAHVIVLQPGTVEIAWAPPFSAVPTAFRAAAGSMSWHAPCAWDAFGIPAALKRDAENDRIEQAQNATGIEVRSTYGRGLFGKGSGRFPDLRNRANKYFCFRTG